MAEKKERKMNAARVCFGISRIGYTPASAICDIIDNAVSAKAKNIHIEIKTESKFANRKNDVTEYLIIDDGNGMNLEQLENALDLGSNDFAYTSDTLSKFGLGLKSASFAQGRKLEVISGNGKEINKEYVDLDEIEDVYFSVREDLSDDDKSLINKYFSDKKTGTIIRITKIHKNNHPSLKSTLDELKTKIGVIYYYFLEKDLHIYLQNEELKAFDALFVSEAKDKLDENIWDGRSVQWLLKPDTFMLDSSSNINCAIEITMLPHPGVFKSEGISNNSIRDKYKISAQNYGFYIYREGRLINWANRLDIIPQDQDYYAFRGRINISKDADDAFNIDVSKSHLNLSEEARDSLNDFIADYKRKCKSAWQNAWNKYQAQLSSSTNEQSNIIVNDVGDYIESIPEDDSREYEEEVKKREANIIEEYKNKSVQDTISRIKDEENIEKKLEEITPEEIKKTIKGSSNVDSLSKIFKVSSLTDNGLWEPYTDAEIKECVRISTSHRFSKLLYEDNTDNHALQILFEIFLFIQSKSELQIRKNLHDLKTEEITKILNEYRITVSEMLSKLCRKEEGKLPPNFGE